MRKTTLVVCCVALFIASAVMADGQRLYADPFLQCEDPALVLRTPDLTNEPGNHVDSVSVSLPEERLLQAPGEISIHGVDLRGYSMGYAYIEQAGETNNSCTYKYREIDNSFLLAGCELMEGDAPSAIRTGSMRLKVPGMSALSRVSAYARFKGKQSEAGCAGRVPLNGQRFFNRPGASKRLWFAVVDEALIAPGSVVSLATQLAQSVNGSLEATYTTGPLGFAIWTTAVKAQQLSQDSRLRFVENQPFFKGMGIRNATGTAWAQDRIDQSVSAPSCRPTFG